MIRLSRKTLIFLAGALWFAVGCMLMTIGIRLILGKISSPSVTLFAHLLQSKEEGGLLFIALALFVGYMKGKFVLSKAARRQVQRIAALQEPLSLTSLYSKGYYFLIPLMIALGISLRFFCPDDIRGAIDIAVGSALLHGASSYFRSVLKPLPS